MEKTSVVCLYNSPSVNKQYFLEHFKVFRESCCQMSNCFRVGDMNIDLLETSAIGIRHLNSLKLNGCYQGRKEPTRVTPTSKSLFDHIVHYDCVSKLEFRVIKTNFADHYATYVYLDIPRKYPFVFNKPGQQCYFFEIGITKRST